jgi:RNA polymerase sigma-70 factor (ECF subfamily)
MRPCFKAPAGKRTDLFERFLEAVETGEMSGLIELLSKDVVLHSDGGGKAVAVPNEVRGADKVARGILGGLQRLVPKTLVRKLVRINGAPGLVNYLQGKPHSVLTLDIQDGRIREIYIVTNPEKLSHIPPLTN